VNVETESNPNTQMIARGDTRRLLLRTMAELFKASGYTDIQARVKPFRAPRVFQGSQEDHRPDLTCRQNDKRRTALILDVVTTDVFAHAQAFELRIGLFVSVARALKCELHIACPNVKAGEEYLETLIRKRLASAGVTPNKIWVV
jgi:hypothetical protein